MLMWVISSLVGHYTGHLVIMTIIVLFTLLWAMCEDDTNIRKWINNAATDRFILAKGIIFTGFVISVMHVVYFLILFGMMNAITGTTLVYAVFLVIMFFISVMIFANRVHTV